MRALRARFLAPCPRYRAQGPEKEALPFPLLPSPFLPYFFFASSASLMKRCTLSAPAYSEIFL